MVPKHMLGRYEYTDWAENSNKYWHIVYDLSTQTYVCSWGRIGTNGQPPKIYDEEMAYKRIKEKIKKGYQKKQGSIETIGTQSVHFIQTLCGG